jgi:hypothetical protein
VTDYFSLEKDSLDNGHNMYAKKELTDYFTSGVFAVKKESI